MSFLLSLHIGPGLQRKLRIVLRPVTSSLSEKRRTRLVRQLRAAQLSLRAWDASIRATAVNGSQMSASEPSAAAVLLAIINQTQSQLDARLYELGVAHQAEAPVTPKILKSSRTQHRSVTQASLLIEVCVEACRGLGRSLCAAFREAQIVADAASARMLYASLREIEKQLWVLDPRRAGS